MATVRDTDPTNLHDLALDAQTDIRKLAVGLAHAGAAPAAVAQLTHMADILSDVVKVLAEGPDLGSAPNGQQLSPSAAPQAQPSAPPAPAAAQPQAPPQQHAQQAGLHAGVAALHAAMAASAQQRNQPPRP